MRQPAEELDERLPGFEQHLKVHVTGCPNSCGQHWIADLALEGKKIKHGPSSVSSDNTSCDVRAAKIFASSSRGTLRRRFAGFLAGELIPAEVRDLATLSTPHGVEG
jgi:sulfite reductase beta subunit-like hemoprotein